MTVGGKRGTYQKHESFSVRDLSVYWSPFVRCWLTTNTKPILLSALTTDSTTQKVNVLSLTQNRMAAIQPDVIFKWNTLDTALRQETVGFRHRKQLPR